jgi:hypothetical protein
MVTACSSRGPERLRVAQLQRSPRNKYWQVEVSSTSLVKVTWRLRDWGKKPRLRARGRSGFAMARSGARDHGSSDFVFVSYFTV